MVELTHDPSEYIHQLQDLLKSDKKKIAFLFGAGTSRAQKNESSLFVESIEKLTENIEKELGVEPKYAKAIAEIKIEIGDKYNIEALLSNLEQKLMVVGNETLNGLEKKDISELVKKVKNLIRKNVSVHDEVERDHDQLKNIIYCDFAEWIKRIVRKQAIEIFTLNYDYLLELGMESKNVPYYDGFTGSYNPFFDSESVENFKFLPEQTKLWKIHGSLGWQYDIKSKKVLRKESDEKDILIYPSTLKYNDSKKQPYISFLDRLSNFLKQDDSVLIICGYSFRDEHINERILTALNSNRSSHVYALFYDVVWIENKKDYNLKKDSYLVLKAKENSKLSIYGHRNAVIGCQYGKWKLQNEPDITDTININSYYDEDAPCDDKQSWTGEGELILPDFCKFVEFLRSLMIDYKINGD